MSKYLNYIMTINGTKGKTSTRQTTIEEMASSYNEAKANYISKFRVLINSNEAIDIDVDGKKSKCLLKSEAKAENTTGTYMLRIRTEIGDITEGSEVRLLNNKGLEEAFLVTGKIETKDDYDQAYMTYCNQRIRLDRDSELNCIMDNTTYGVKGLKDNGVFKELDAKMKGYIQANDTSMRLTEGMRVLIENISEHFKGDLPLKKKWSAYQILKCDHAVREGLYVLELQLVPISPLDDLINGIAYNEKVSDDISYEISGSDVLYVGKNETYEIFPNSTGVSYELTGNSAEIINVTGDGCVLKGVSKGYIVLTAKVQDVKIQSINIMVYG